MRAGSAVDEGPAKAADAEDAEDVEDEDDVAYQNAVLLEDVELSEGDVADLAQLIQEKMEEVSISWDVFQQWELDTLDLTEKEGASDTQPDSAGAESGWRANAIRDKVKSSEDFQDCCSSFLRHCAAGYDRGKVAPYHTFNHAVDATFTLWRVLDLIAADWGGDGRVCKCRRDRGTCKRI
eukprot:g344.t1